MDTAYIDALSHAAESWKVKLSVSGRVIEFKVDTGAEVTAVSDTAFGTMRKQTLKAPTKVLYGPARTELYVVPLVCESLCGQPVDVAVEQFPHLSGLDLADANGSSDNLPVGILVGADCYWKIATGRTIHERAAG
mgnify:CR=1 FL=1